MWKIPFLPEEHQVEVVLHKILCGLEKFRGKQIQSASIQRIGHWFSLLIPLVLGSDNKFIRSMRL